MRFLRFFTSLLLMSVLLGGLTGCGGGSGTTTAQRMVTITLRWPTKSAAKSSGGNARTRVTPVGTGAVPTNAIVEIYDGVTRIGVVSYTSGVQSQSISVPAKSLTFYANAFAATGAFDPTLYTTNPATGVLGKGAGGTTPLAATDNHPLAHAVTVQDVSQSLAVSFTLDNTIVAIELVAQNPATAPTTTLTSSAALDAPTVYLNNLVKARALDGAAFSFAHRPAASCRQCRPHQ